MRQTPRFSIRVLLWRHPAISSFCFAILFCFSVNSQLFAQSPTPQGPPAQQQPSKPADTVPPAAAVTEVSTHDSPATFKVRVNLVLVRVVVRDRKSTRLNSSH